MFEKNLKNYHKISDYFNILPKNKRSKIFKVEGFFIDIFRIFDDVRTPIALKHKFCFIQIPFESFKLKIYRFLPSPMQQSFFANRTHQTSRINKQNN